MQLPNWAGNVVHEPDVVHRPATSDQLQDVVGAASKIRAFGSGHSFNDLPSAESLIDLRAMPEFAEVDTDSGAARVSAHSTYGSVARALRPHGRALHNLASLPHISVAGAIATGTHGSGDSLGGLATAVTELEMVTATGELLTLRREDPSFPGAVVGLGALGIVTSVTLETVEEFQLRQLVFEDMEWSAFDEHFDQIFELGYSVSAFTRWGEQIEQVWLKQRLDAALGASDAEGAEGAGGPVGPGTEELFGALRAPANRHPLRGIDPAACTPQLGVPGLWCDRLPHFQMDFEPSAGEEIQSEFFVPREHAVPAFQALRTVGSELAAAIMVSEIRTIREDDLWMSPCHGRDSVAFHFTWVRDDALAATAAATVAQTLSPFAVRPHWGKVFPAAMQAADIFPRAADFVALAADLDPKGCFWNSWMERHLGHLHPNP